MRESVEATQEVDLCLTEPLLKDSGGRAYKKKRRNMLKSVTNAKGLPQTSTNQVESSTLSLVLSHLLSKALIL